MLEEVSNERECAGKDERRRQVVSVDRVPLSTSSHATRTFGKFED